MLSIISLLVAVLLPSLASARETAQATQCLANLHSLGTAMTGYVNDHDGKFWPTYRSNYPTQGETTYYWGTDQTPVNFHKSWLLGYANDNDKVLQCPALPWGSYVPGGNVDQPTTDYGYNAWCLDPSYWGRTTSSAAPMHRKRITQLTKPSELFVFADAAMYWSYGGVSMFQNSTTMDPPTLPWGANTTPTTHFRHQGRANVLCADGHAQGYGQAAADMVQPKEHLGFVGATNAPHYDQ